MNLAHYLNPTEALPFSGGLPKSASIYGKTLFHGVDKELKIDSNSIVIIGVGERRNSTNKGAEMAPDAIREYLFALSGNGVKNPIVDLGNIKQTSSPSDTYLATRDVLSYIFEKGATCLVLGGTHEITWPIYMAASDHFKRINLSLIDYTLDMGNNDDDFSSKCFIDKLLAQPLEKLFSISIIGYQSYLTSGNHINLLSQNYFELIRLGQIRDSIENTEPILRDSQIVSFDMGSIRQSDSPSNINPSPNGLYAEEACQLARYAGISQKSKAFGIFETNCSNRICNQDSHLAAQVAWHFIDAFYSRKSYPDSIQNVGDTKKYYVKSPIADIDLVFIHNIINDTWWMELPGTEKTEKNSIIVSCSYNDYKMASNGDLPERWYKAWKKMT